MTHFSTEMRALTARATVEQLCDYTASKKPFFKTNFRSFQHGYASDFIQMIQYASQPMKRVRYSR
jgi:hypothetical protein